MRIRHNIGWYRAICSKSANKFRSLCSLVSSNESILLTLACLELKALVFRTKSLHLAICQIVENSSSVAVVVLQNISCCVLDSVSCIASLCCHVVIYISKSSFECSLSVAAILLSYRLFILYICRFPRQFGLYLHPIATIGAGYSCRDYWLSVLTR